MDIKDIKVKAKSMGIILGKKTKTELIKEIQLTEGNNPCYRSAIAQTCGIVHCLWRDDCKALTD